MISTGEVFTKTIMKTGHGVASRWADLIMRSAEYYLSEGTLNGRNEEFNTEHFFNLEDTTPISIEPLDTRQMLEDALALACSQAEGNVWASGILNSALGYLQTGQFSRMTEFHTEAFWESPEEEEEEPEMCPTGTHELDEDGETTCECIHVDECGCDIDRRYKGVCSRCDNCESCCQDNGECFYCEGCRETCATDDRCRACNECRDCCDNNSECWTCQGCSRRYDGDMTRCSNCETCKRCCDCWTCGNCHESYYRDSDVGSCSECDRCSECCDCTHCGYCGEVCEEYCDNCERGDCCCREDDSCELRDSSGRSVRTGRRGGLVEFGQRRLQFHESGRLEFKRNPLRRHISVEMEVDRSGNAVPATKLKAAIEKWGDSVVEDGSLSGAVAHEVNTMPTNGDRFLEHLKDLTDGYAEVEASCSSDCGLHVHINCKDLTFYDMRKVLGLYARTERALFELVARCRLNGSYSLICGYNYLNMSSNPSIFKRQLLSTLYVHENQLIPEKHNSSQIGAKIREGKGDKHGTRDTGMRYRALNIHSFFHRGSIEFRHHEGSVDYNEVTSWALVCGNMIEAAAKMSEAQIRALPDEPHEALLAILPASLHEYCNRKWEAKSLPATLFSQERTVYARGSVDDSTWREFSTVKGNLPTVLMPTPPPTPRPQRDEPCDCGLSVGCRVTVSD